MKSLNRTLSVAPMMDWTDPHCRFFLRLISQHTLLYTEMITTGALLHGDAERFLYYHPDEHPLAIQLGGNDPVALAACAKMAEAAGYDEVNLNVGCPSDRVASGAFGLCLMGKPQLVADCVAAMKQAVSIPVSVKTRIGFDHQDSYEALQAFVSLLIDHGVDHICIHARKGWLNGLSPKENRTIPPLMYDTVYRIKQDFPTMDIGINGGIETLAAAKMHLQHVNSVMIGRAAYHNPYLLAEADAVLFNDAHPVLTRAEIVQKLIPYIDEQLDRPKVKLKHITRHILGLFHGERNGRLWRQCLSDQAHLADSGSRLVQEALELTLG